MTKKIVCIGNCQAASIAKYLFEILDNYSVKYVPYNDNFIKKMFLHETNKYYSSQFIFLTVFDKKDAIETLMESDIIIYQNIKKETSPLFNEEKIYEYNENCIKVSLPSIRLDYNDYLNSLKELKFREKIKNNNIIVSDIIEENTDKRLMLLNKSHPNTFFFMQILNKILEKINENKISIEKYNFFMENNNYIGLSIT